VKRSSSVATGEKQAGFHRCRERRSCFSPVATDDERFAGFAGGLTDGECERG